MLVRWGDFDRTFARMEDFRRRMDRLMEEADVTPRGLASASIPRANLWDTGKTFILEAELPGFTQNEIKLSLNQDVLTLEGEHKHEAPEKHSVHRRERASQRFARSFTLPTRVDPELVTAELKQGVLTVTMTKNAEAQPRQIPVRAE